jgi:hypothetical protein
MDYTEIVKKLIGDIEPIGKTEVDEKRLENLKNMCNLVNDLVCAIDNVVFYNLDRVEHSMKIMGEYADSFLKNDLGIKE